MELRFTDFNGAADVIAAEESMAWSELSSVISAMPLHLKESDQEGKVGSLIFDPVGTNAYFKRELSELGWVWGTPIHDRFQFLGKDVDFCKTGLLLEVQFSNYPFLLNNLLRSELFFKARSTIAVTPALLKAVVIITKAGMFPSSNSTLYYEQAERQLDALAVEKVFTAPLRLVGLFAPANQVIDAVKTSYSSRRYSRTMAGNSQLKVKLLPKGSGQTHRLLETGE